MTAQMFVKPLNIRNQTDYYGIGYINFDNREIKIEDLTGSIYYNEKVVPATIIDLNTGETINVYVRYRIFDDKFEVNPHYDSDKIVYLDRSDQYSLIMNGKEFIFSYILPTKINGVNNGYLLTLLKSDKVKLYKRMSQKINQKVKDEYGQARTVEMHLVNNSHYFVEINNNLVEIIPHKKEAYKAFPDHQKELETYIKKEKLKFKDEEEDLKALVNYYISL
ncbi:hypothetical protein DNG35_04650 [Mesonia sp. K7]|nr:hypothetical protein DNG35_04650 [Mesonia sp. K7]